MAHQLRKSGYAKLVDRLNRFPQGAPPSELLDKILGILFSDAEARMVALLPIRPFTASRAARIWKIPMRAARKILDRLAARALLIDIRKGGETLYVLPPPMAGFFEFSMMRTRRDIDQKLLSELFYQYLNVEDEFIRNLFTLGDTQLGRVFVNEEALSEENALHILDYERASEVIRTASHRGISLCYCRHKMDHVGKACDRPQDICMTFNTSAASLIRHGHAREVDVLEGLDLLDKAYGHNLVQFGENVRQGVNFICNCCGCCCEGLLAAQRFAMLNPVHTTNFIPVLNADTCRGCGRCADICPVNAMIMKPAGNPDHPKQKVAHLDPDLCLGCGLCVRACRDGCLSLMPREKRVITPLNGAHRAVVMAIERGMLQNLIFDNQLLFSHRAMATLLGVILKLGPVQRSLANRQLHSRYLESLIARLDDRLEAH